MRGFSFFQEWGPRSGCLEYGDHVEVIDDGKLWT